MVDAGTPLLVVAASVRPPIILEERTVLEVLHVGQLNQLENGFVQSDDIFLTKTERRYCLQLGAKSAYLVAAY